MKKFFTLAAAAAVTATAMAHPANKTTAQPVDIQPWAQQVMNTNMAAIQQNKLTDIEGNLLGKRSFVQGNIEWEMYAIQFGHMVDALTWNGEAPTFDDFPEYAVEYCLSGYNRTTGDQTSLLAAMLFWPSKYYEQMMTWTGPWDHITGVNSSGQQYDYYDIPVEDRDYTIVPIEDLLPGKPLAAPFKFTYDAGPSTRAGETAEPEQWAGPWCWACFGYGGLKYNGKGCKAMTYWDWDTMSGDCVTVTFNDYLLEDVEENFNISNFFPLSIGSTVNNQWVETGTSNFTLEFDGTGYSNGFAPKNYNMNLADMHIFNAGILDEDTNNFYELGDEDQYQQYYVMGCDDQLLISWTKDNNTLIEKDPTFTNCLVDNRYVTYFLADENSDSSLAYYMYGYLFSPFGGDEPSNEQWNIKLPYEYTYEWGGQKITIEDYLVPSANMFVPRGVRTSNGYSAWSQYYGIAGVYRGYAAIPENEEAYMAINTADGFVFRYKDEFENYYNVTFDGKCVYHPDFENILTMMELDTTGEFVPDGGSAVKNVFGDLSGVKVAARNGMITIDSMNAANVQVISLNGQLVNAAKVNANGTVNVPAAKGAYIVKVGNVVRKVVL